MRNSGLSNVLPPASTDESHLGSIQSSKMSFQTWKGMSRASYSRVVSPAHGIGPSPFQPGAPARDACPHPSRAEGCPACGRLSLTSLPASHRAREGDARSQGETQGARGPPSKESASTALQIPEPGRRRVCSREIAVVGHDNKGPECVSSLGPLPFAVC
ncbi:uncharacterized protein LOC115940449 [Leptonychotes weddellii]|uniref:Uncharacterized protein LOC115940449 n=1 Tax=Leptonychotes weddellii TaxID=9713 RepID=A0A7F8QMG6_LEPWE|nr:uncharacterized protein LOC115940449 [Leptonychotes weddellii]